MKNFITLRLFFLLTALTACGTQVVEFPGDSCADDDGSCFTDCNNNNDNDCEPICGNDEQEQGETCDPQETCPVDCNDANACTIDTLGGSADNCDASCTNTDILVCSGDDGCCLPGCDSTNDNDCVAFCGNDIIEVGETCDPLDSCPTSCDDLNACTTDALFGSAATCDAVCVNDAILVCADNDDCCALGCNSTNDNNCSASCGNNLLEFGETCDPAGTCPTTCNDNDFCTTDTLLGSSSTCDAECIFDPIQVCINNDGCCAPGCDSANDNDCNACDQATIALGSAANFAVLAGSTITSTGPTSITGDIGSFSGTSVTGFPPGTLIGAVHAGDSTAGQGIADLTAAFDDAAGRSLCPVSVAGNLGGQTLLPGLYQSTSSLAISSGDLTLDAQGNGNAVFIFQAASTLTTTPGRKVILINGAKASNIFWQVGSSATLGTTSTFEGNIMAGQSISMDTGATLNGRALTKIAAVTMDANTIVKP